MGPYTFAQAFLCGFFGFAAIASFVMWRRSRRDLSLLAIAVGSFIWAAQSMAVVALATSTTIEGARHFLQEDKGEELARVVADFVNGEER